MGVALLQRLIDHNVATNFAVLGASVTAGVPAVSERLTTTTAMLAARGMDAVAASRAATSLLGRIVTGQSTVIAFDAAFNAVALLFVIAAPVLVTIKIGLSRYTKMRMHRHPGPRKLDMRHPAPKSVLAGNAGSDDAQEGIAAFVAKCHPQFRGGQSFRSAVTAFVPFAPPLD
jgi:DHA2 family multidrug resistance protein